MTENIISLFDVLLDFFNKKEKYETSAFFVKVRDAWLEYIETVKPGADAIIDSNTNIDASVYKENNESKRK